MSAETLAALVQVAVAGAATLVAAVTMAIWDSTRARRGRAGDAERRRAVLVEVLVLHLLSTDIDHVNRAGPDTSMIAPESRMPAERRGNLLSRSNGSPRVRWPRTSLLGRVSDPLRAALLGLGTAVTLPAGSRFIRQGEPGSHAYLLVNGCVRVTGNDGGRDPLLAVRVSGDLVGEMALLTGGVRSATVSACGPTVARRIGGDELRGFLMRHPEAAVQVAAAITERLRWANQRRVDFVAVAARPRVSRVLVALNDAYGQDTSEGRDLGVALTQEEIASLAGVRLTTAEKALRALAHAGISRLGYRRIVVTDVDGLLATTIT